MRQSGHTQIICKSRDELNLLDQAAVHRFFESSHIEYAFVAAAKVGGIYANSTYPADFLYENLTISSNIIHAAAQYNVEKLLFLGSSCIYPRLAPQPIQETSLLTGPLETTNEAYALAKIAGLKLCEMFYKQYKKRFISAMPTNLYGIGDNFHPENSHVIPGMMRRFHEAKMQNLPEVKIWGTGKPMREFLYVDDLADALYFLMEKYEDFRTINIGTGNECSIAELAEKMKAIVGYPGNITFDTSKPDGTPRKVLDPSRINQLGWKAKVPFLDGLKKTYTWALEKQAIA